jgi:hypothetical protein
VANRQKGSIVSRGRTCAYGFQGNFYLLFNEHSDLGKREDVGMFAIGLAYAPDGPVIRYTEFDGSSRINADVFCRLLAKKI